MVQVKVTDPILETPKTVRIMFKKTGNMQYISHLDLVRTMMRTVMRAGMPLWYSEGFNPRPKLTFATPMSVGLQSQCELLDIKINQDVCTESLKNALNANLTDEIYVTDVYFPVRKLSELAYSSYIIKIHTSCAGDALACRINTLLSSSPVTVLKKSKAGDRNTDISDCIKSVNTVFDGSDIVIETVLCSSSADFINPEYIITFLKNECGILSGPLDTEYYEIIRTNIYDSDMHEFR